MDHSEVKHLPKVDHTPAELDAASRLLLKAADLIDRGYLITNGQTRDHKGGYCVLGALEDSTGKPYSSDGAVWDAMFRVYKAIGGKRSKGDYEYLEVCNWNNTHDDKAPVVAKLRAVALGL